MKYFKTILIASILLICKGAFGQGTGDNSLLWRISGKDLKHPSYLFGTIHLICPEDYVWTDKMKLSFSQCEKVCFEMDLDDHETMLAASGGFVDTSGKTLDQYFTKDQYGRLKKFVKDSIGLDISMFVKMKPIALSSLIEMKASPCMVPVSYEERIMAEALGAKKEVIGLELASEQIDVLETIPTDSVVRDLMESIDHFSESKAEYKELVDLYKTQQLPLMYQKIMSSEHMGDNMAPFLDDRNKKWISRMADKMKLNAIFFAVGAGHLLGTNGVIQLLRTAGYTVEIVK